MKKNLIMRGLAVVIAAVLVATSAVPAYAGEPDGGQTEVEKDNDREISSEILSSDVYGSEEDSEEEIVKSGPESGDAGIDKLADDPETEEVIAEAGEEDAKEVTPAEENEDTELLGEGEYVAKVKTADGEQNFTSFDDAARFWMEKGDGAELVLLDDVRTGSINSVSQNGLALIKVVHGTEEAPMILDLNDHGILYDGGAGSEMVIRVEVGCFFELRDSSSTQTVRYLKINNDEGRATEIVTEKPDEGESYVQISGGYLAGGLDRGGITNQGTFTMSGGAICGNVPFGVNNGVQGTFIMNGGKICKNNGCGVRNANRFEMNGGEISDNNGIGVKNNESAYSPSFTMNGGEISRNLGCGVYNFSDGQRCSFTMNGGKISENSADKGGGVCSGTINSYYGATFTMTGGEISENTAASDGGGVYISSHGNAPFTMTGGEISGNTATEFGGGICIDNDSNLDDVSFIIDGGKISGNSATYGGGVSLRKAIDNSQNVKSISLKMNKGEICENTATVDGGGVYIKNYDYGDGHDGVLSFELTGGKISKNIASGNAGGVYNIGSSFTMSGGEISGNSANIAGGVRSERTTSKYPSFTLSGGKICGNTAAQGGGVISNSGTFVMSGGEISNNTSEDGRYQAVLRNGATITFDGTILAGTAVDGSDAHPVTASEVNGAMVSYGYIKVIEVAVVKTSDTEQTFGYFADALSFWQEKGAEGAGAELKLLTDFKTDSKIEINGGTEDAPMVLDLNGNGILYTGVAGDCVISIASGKFFELKDSGDTETVRYIKLGELGRGTAVVYAEPSEGDYLQISGGYIAGGENCGVLNKGTLTMNGGTICGNHSVNGGGVVNKGTFTMNAGAIRGNKATFGGGGVCNNGTLTMSGGEISGNVAPDARALFNNGGTIDFDGDVCVGTVVDGTGARIVDAEQAKTDLHTYGYIALLGLRYEPIDDMTYTGSAIAPTIRAYFGDRPLKEKTDYTVKFRKNTDVGKAEFTVTFKGNYSGKVDGEFNIVPKDIGDSDVIKTAIAPKEADTKSYKPVPVITYNKKKLAATKDFTVKYYNEDGTTEVSEPMAAGKYLARVTASGKNYKGSDDVPFIITASKPIMVSKLNIAKIPDQKYKNGTPVEPGLTVKNGKQPVGADCYEASYKNNIEIGTASVTITGKEDKGYIGSKTVTFKIVGGALGKVTVNMDSFLKTVPYDGKEQSNYITLIDKATGKNLTGMEKDAYNELNNKSSVDYVISYENNVNAGTATMILTGVNGWTGTVKKTFKIDKFDIKKNEGGKFTVELNQPSYPYAKAGVKPEPDVKFDGKLLTKGTDYTLAYTNNTAVGGTKAPTIKITGKGNFTGVNDSTTFVIGKANLANEGVTVTAKDVVWASKKGNYKTTVTVTDKDGKKLSLNTDYSLSFSTNPSGTPELGKDAKVDLGPEGYTTVYVIVAASENAKCAYEGSVPGSFRLCEKDIGKFSATVGERTFTGREVTITGDDIEWKSGKTDLNLTEGSDFEIVKDSYDKNVNKGTASVMVKGKGKYCGTKKVTFKITTNTVSGWKALLRSLFAWL